jgi:phosphate starvation-inducible PhoH-like protein
MRGNSFEYSTVILSEAQNCTLHELISIVTRVSANSKIFINGDFSQSDIGRKSGFRDFVRILNGVDGVGIMELGDEHQVRNPMIVDINKRYKQYLNGKLQTQDHLDTVQSV